MTTPTRRRRVTRAAGPPPDPHTCRCRPYPYATFRGEQLVRIELRHDPGTCGLTADPQDPADWGWTRG